MALPPPPNITLRRFPWQPGLAPPFLHPSTGVSFDFFPRAAALDCRVYLSPSYSYSKVPELALCPRPHLLQGRGAAWLASLRLLLRHAPRRGSGRKTGKGRGRLLPVRRWRQWRLEWASGGRPPPPPPLSTTLPVVPPKHPGTGRRELLLEDCGHGRPCVMWT